jgi:hypothetical protein
MHPKRLAADTAYGTGRFLAFVTGVGIIPHIPRMEPSVGKTSDSTRGNSA